MPKGDFLPRFARLRNDADRDRKGKRKGKNEKQFPLSLYLNCLLNKDAARHVSTELFLFRLQFNQFHFVKVNFRSSFERHNQLIDFHRIHT